MREYDVTVQFRGCAKCSDVYTIQAKNEDEAKETALQMALEDIQVVEIEDVTFFYINPDKYLNKKFRHYLLNQVDLHDEEWTILTSNEEHSLIELAKRITLPDVKKLEVIGTNDEPKDYKSCRIIFTREL